MALTTIWLIDDINNHVWISFKIGFSYFQFQSQLDCFLQSKSFSLELWETLNLKGSTINNWTIPVSTNGNNPRKEGVILSWSIAFKL